jgi:hypothetical protein
MGVVFSKGSRLGRRRGLTDFWSGKERSLGTEALTRPKERAGSTHQAEVIAYPAITIIRRELPGQTRVTRRPKSHIGPSFGINFNNRTEEAIGSALDLWAAYREDAFGKQPPPFVGWLMMVEDAPASRNKVKVISPHYAIFEEFKNTSYLERDDLLGQRMVKE